MTSSTRGHFHITPHSVECLHTIVGPGTIHLHSIQLEQVYLLIYVYSSSLQQHWLIFGRFMNSATFVHNIILQFSFSHTLFTFFLFAFLFQKCQERLKYGFEKPFRTFPAQSSVHQPFYF